MNIFVLDNDPVLAAQWQYDKHVVKMVLETAQLLSQAIRLNADWLAACPEPKSLYGITHQHHPCARWTRSKLEHLDWLIQHGQALSDEYTLRFGRRHASQRIIDLARATYLNLPNASVRASTGILEHVQAMPDCYKDRDPVIGYRLYYLYEKCDVDSKWSRRSHLPDWLLDRALEYRPKAQQKWSR